jgi:hypothetical protein
MRRDPDKRAVVGVFERSEDARRAIEALRDDDFSAKDIGVLAHDKDGDPHIKSIKDLDGNKAGAGAATGAAVGAGGGALWALGIAAGILPAIGPVIAGGTLAAIAASAAGGAAAGGITGALVGAGIDDDEAAYYDEEFRQGRTVVVVHPDDADETARALAIMNRSNSVNRYAVQEPRPYDGEPRTSI